MGLFGRHGGISNFFHKVDRGAKKAFTKSVGAINRAAGEVKKVVNDGTLNAINDVAGKVINSPITEGVLLATAPEFLPAFEVGKGAYNTANSAFQATRSGVNAVERVTHDNKKDRRIRDASQAASASAPSVKEQTIQKAKPRVVTDKQAITFV